MPRSGSSTRVVLDTSAYSRFRAGDPAVTEWIASATVVLVPAVVVGELEAGFRLGSRLKENLTTLDEFLEEPFVALQPVTREVSRSYGQLFAQLRRRGTPIPVNEIWIAACAVVAKATLVTFDHDFELVPDLACAVL